MSEFKSSFNISNQKSSSDSTFINNNHTAFIFLVEPPCTSDGFRPNNLETSHSKRRDSLCRILKQSLYIGNNNPSPCIECDYIFTFENPDNNNNNDKINGVIAMDSSLVKQIPIPSEKSLLKLWRASFNNANKTNNNSLLLSLSSENFLNNNNNNNLNMNTNSCICSTSLDSDFMVVPNLQLSSSSSSSSSLSYSDVSTVGKRALLKMMQSNASLEFLRQFNLNGSEEMVLRKKNRADIMKAFQHFQSSSSSKSKSIIKNNNLEEYINISKKNKNTYLMKTFCLLLYRIKQKIGPNVDLSVLILHEDFEQELPVFGYNHISLKDNFCTVCVLGGVRDMTQRENDALQLACKIMKVRLVGTNLGRVPEFTSKIAAAINIHALCNVLSGAVQQLEELDETKSIFKIQSLRQKHQSIAQKQSSSENISNPKNYLNVIAWWPMNVKEVLDAEQTKLAPLIQIVVCTLWKSRLFSEVANDQCTTDVVPSLTLIFKDGNLATITQEDLVRLMAEKHQAVPSEYQIVALLKYILQCPLIQIDDILSISSILNKLLRTNKFKLSKHEKKKIRICDIYGLGCLSSSTASIQNKNGGDTSSLQMFYESCYQQKCSCSSNNNNNNNSNNNNNNDNNNTKKKKRGCDSHFFVLFRDHRSWTSNDESLVNDFLSKWVYKSNTEDEKDDENNDTSPPKKRKKRKFYCRLQMIPQQPRHQQSNPSLLFPSFIITTIIHYIYHNRFVETINDNYF